MPAHSGLSPRVRGNLPVRIHEVSGGRSIPARAGEPVDGDGTINLLQVYPRACGGTALFCAGSLPKIGLSPRVRGNLGPMIENR